MEALVVSSEPLVRVGWLVSLLAAHPANKITAAVATASLFRTARLLWLVRVKPLALPSFAYNGRTVYCQPSKAHLPRVLFSEVYVPQTSENSPSRHLGE